MNQSNRQNPKAIMLWTIWFSLVGAIVYYQFKFGGGWLSGKDTGLAVPLPVSSVTIGSLVAAAVIRWLFIPRTKDIRRLLILMVVGLALSEAVAFYSIFLFGRDLPETKMEFFILSLLSAFQFIPIYAKDPVAGAKF